MELISFLACAAYASTGDQMLQFLKSVLWLISKKIIQCVPLATKPGISLIILTPMKILQRNLKRSTFVEWEMKRNVSVVCVCSAPNCCKTEQLSASQPACFLPDVPLCWSLCHLAEGAYKIRLLFVSVSVCVSSYRIVGKCIGILWRSECLLVALIGKQNR
jgi:hypothetical protein